MHILIATHNKQKLARYGRLFANVSGVNVRSLAEKGITEKSDESHESSIENAREKARFYGGKSGLVTVAIDEAAQTNFLPDHEQPGVYLRRFTKERKELTDDEIVAAWKEIFDRYPEEDKQFTFDHAFAFYDPNDQSVEVTSVAATSYVSPHISDRKTNGYPLSRVLSPEPGSRPYAERDAAENDARAEKIFAPVIACFAEWLRGRSE